MIQNCFEFVKYLEEKKLFFYICRFCLSKIPLYSQCTCHILSLGYQTNKTNPIRL
ncbi:hypothetical protein MBAV_003580 [Candidatus Magnetobacterium bavaricum]|uniref:Uncharacterized protein n=1 Tax=Candidatus Magnetobacterium bavaricum TaxID=29290 RepID=A0A0F3GU27_9BACT|nr:hypothetical protein MBAV_003580 [Candidatus Magnetobacterium bavaricum]